MTRIHPTALVDSGAELDSSVEVGPYTVIGPHVRVGAGTRIGAHCVIEGRTTIGQNNQIFQFNSLGAIPQDKKYAGEPCELRIGDRNTIREFCTFNIGTAQDQGVTRVGDDNWIMAYVHLAHDCQIANHTIFANNTQLAGHVHVGDWVIMSGFSAVHQFCRIGEHAFVGMNTSLTQDVPPYVLVSGNPAEAHGANLEGLKRRGFSRDQIHAIRHAYKALYKSGLTLDEAKAALEQQIAELPADAADSVQRMRSFLDLSQRGIVR